MPGLDGISLAEPDHLALRDLEAILPLGSPWGGVLKHLAEPPRGAYWIRGSIARGISTESAAFWTTSSSTGARTDRVTGLCLHTNITGSPGSVLRGSLPDSLSRLDALEDLSLKCDLEEVPRWVMELPSLRRLDLSRNPRITLPDDIDRLANLRYLDLATVFGRLTELPPALGRLGNLETLNLGNNRFTSLPDLSGLVALRDLDVTGNPIGALPKGLGNLARLERLSADDTGLRRIPEELTRLPLTELFLCFNQLEVLPPEIGSLAGLRKLDVGRNRLRALPPEIGSLARLVSLETGRNSLESLPAEIGNLTQLRFLDLERNRLTGLPDTIGGLGQLEHLQLRSNPLAELPASMGGLASLATLDITGTPLRALPESLAGLASLQRLHTSLAPHEVPAALSAVVRATNDEKAAAAQAFSDRFG